MKFVDDDDDDDDVSKIDVLCRLRVSATYPLFNLQNITEAWSVRYISESSILKSKTGVLNVTTVRYSLHKCSKTILC